ncbi:MAG TPA: hypothetical protein VJY62_08030 [Bacteroidia bacterium]|nr:hypothetical protein [Bacteroidia bacterium]
MTAANSQWKGLYNIAGVSAIIMVIFIPLQMAVFVLFPPPSTVIGWFELFQKNKFIGLIDMDLLLIADQVFMCFIFLALYTALRSVSPSYITIALVLGLTGVAAYYASTVAFEMLSLSNQYSVAANEEEKSILLASGKVMIAAWQGTAFDVGYVIEGAALLIIAITMLQSSVFNKTTAVVGIILGVMSLLPPTVGKLGMFFAIGSLIPLVIWNVLIAKRFFQLSRLEE